MTDLLERVARAIKEARALPGTRPVARLSDVDRRAAQAALREVLEVLKEPTPAQVAATVTNVSNPSDADKAIAAEAVKMLGTTDANTPMGIVVASEVVRDFRAMLLSSPLSLGGEHD